MLDPKCLKPKKGRKVAAYTADGYILPCCWLDESNADEKFVYDAGLKSNHLKVSNVESIDIIITSSEWENFFNTLLKNPNAASPICRRKCKA